MSKHTHILFQISYCISIFSAKSYKQSDVINNSHDSCLSVEIVFQLVLQFAEVLLLWPLKVETDFKLHFNSFVLLPTMPRWQDGVFKVSDAQMHNIDVTQHQYFSSEGIGGGYFLLEIMFILSSCHC